MRIYAQRPGRIALQVLADLAMVAWVVLVVVLAQTAKTSVLKLDVLARRLSGAGDEISQGFGSAAQRISTIPLVGPDIAKALSSVTDTGDSLSTTGRDLGAGLASVAADVALVITLVGIVPVLIVWLALRIRYALLARSALRADPDLLALQALSRRSTAALRHVSSEPAAAWRKGDPAVVAGLADVERAALGLRPVSPSP